MSRSARESDLPGSSGAEAEKVPRSEREIAGMRLECACSGRWKRGHFFKVLAIGWCSIVEAQVPTPPTPSSNPSPGQSSPAPASRELSVEERLTKLEEANRKLLEHNRQ